MNKWGKHKTKISPELIKKISTPRLLNHFRLIRFNNWGCYEVVKNDSQWIYEQSIRKELSNRENIENKYEK